MAGTSATASCWIVVPCRHQYARCTSKSLNAAKSSASSPLRHERLPAYVGASCVRDFLTIRLAVIALYLRRPLWLPWSPALYQGS